MARPDEIILENLTNRGLGSSPVAFRELGVQNLPSLRGALATSDATRESERQKRLSEFMSLVNKNAPSRGGGGSSAPQPPKIDYDKVIPFGYHPGDAGTEPTIQLAKLDPSRPGYAQTINTSIQNANQRYGIAHTLGLPNLGRVNGLNAGSVSSFLADLTRSGSNTQGLRQIQELLAQQLGA